MPDPIMYLDGQQREFLYLSDDDGWLPAMMLPLNVAEALYGHGILVPEEPDAVAHPGATMLRIAPALRGQVAEMKAARAGLLARR